MLSWRYSCMLNVVMCYGAARVFSCYNSNPPSAGRLVFFRVITATHRPSRIGGGLSAAVAGFGAADAFGAVFFDALRGGMQREARAQTTSARVAPVRPRNTPLLDKFQTLTRAPNVLCVEGYTENILWRSLNIMRCCYPGPGVVTVIRVNPITVLLK